MHPDLALMVWYKGYIKKNYLSLDIILSRLHISLSFKESTSSRLLGGQ